MVQRSLRRRLGGPLFRPLLSNVVGWGTQVQDGVRLPGSSQFKGV